MKTNDNVNRIKSLENLNLKDEDKKIEKYYSVIDWGLFILGCLSVILYFYLYSIENFEFIEKINKFIISFLIIKLIPEKLFRNKFIIGFGLIAISILLYSWTDFFALMIFVNYLSRLFSFNEKILKNR